MRLIWTTVLFNELCLKAARRFLWQPTSISRKAFHSPFPLSFTFPVTAEEMHTGPIRTYAENGFVSIALPMVGEEGKRGAGWGKCGSMGLSGGTSTGTVRVIPQSDLRSGTVSAPVDYLLTLKDANGRAMVAKDKIGMAGLSGGSARTFWTVIADPRIACAVASCGFTAIADYDRPGGINSTCDVHLFYNCFGLTYGELYSLIALRHCSFSMGPRIRSIQTRSLLLIMSGRSTSFTGNRRDLSLLFMIKGTVTVAASGIVRIPGWTSGSGRETHP